MSRSGYDDGCDNMWAHIRWRGQVASATRGKRGQKMFVEMKAALEAMPVKSLVAENLELPDGSVCALGALGKARGIDMTTLEADDSEQMGKAFDIAHQLAAEVAFMNDERFWYATNAERWVRVHKWVCEQIRPDRAPNDRI